MKATRSDKIITADTLDSNGNVECMFHQSSSHYGGIRSAINHVKICQDCKQKKNEKRYINIYCGNEDNGNCIEIYAWFQISRKKKTISLETYVILAKTLFVSGEKRNIE